MWYFPSCCFYYYHYCYFVLYLGSLSLLSECALMEDKAIFGVCVCFGLVAVWWCVRFCGGVSRVANKMVGVDGVNVVSHFTHCEDVDKKRKKEDEWFQCPSRFIVFCKCFSVHLMNKTNTLFIDVESKHCVLHSSTTQ